VSSKQEAIRLLREEGRQCVDSRRHAQALDVFAKLEALDPAEPEWPRRAAECHAALKNPKQQAEALARAAERFDGARIPNKAEALCKLSLGIDPRNARARTLLDELERLAEQTRSIRIRQSVKPQALQTSRPSARPRTASPASPAAKPSARPKPPLHAASRAQAALAAQSRLELAMRARRARGARIDLKK
jgi:tetratricopeptide (TPR) repeat protein